MGDIELKDLSNDKPLTGSERDRLGFGGIAQTLAKAFQKNDLSHGLVIGVEGTWGAGKTSLVNLALNELENLSLKEDEKKQKQPEIIRFSPWLVGTRNEMIEQLFADLEPAILKLVPEPMKDDIKTMIGRYAYVPSVSAKLAKFGAMVGVPVAGMVAKLLDEVSQVTMEYSKKSLGELKRDLRIKLVKLSAPIIVFVDDLDRLDPCEVVEVLRLVKSVADFPNVTYILAYDPVVVVDTVECALGISDGKSYIEKVIQASFKVPSAMNFDLRNWLIDEISLLLDSKPLEHSAKVHLARVCHKWGREYLKTPRDVVRVVNLMKLHFVPVKDNVDPGDMVFLQLVRLKNSNLYGWIERYVSNLSEYSEWGRIPAENRERLENELRTVFTSEKKEQDALISRLAELHFPMLRNMLDTFVYSAHYLDSFASKKKRLACPIHFSYYFSFDRAPGTVSNSEFELFLSDCECEPDRAVSTFRQMIEKRRPQGGTLAELLLDRITAERSAISEPQIKGLFLVFGKAIDELALQTEAEPSMILNGDVDGVFGLISQVESDSRLQCLQDLFTEAKSLGWLAGIIRSSTFAHGVYGDREDAKENRLLSEEEFRTCAEIFAKRLSKEPSHNLLKTPDFLNLLYAWYQLGYPNEAQTWIKEQTKGDEEFVEVLCAMGRGHFSFDDVQYTPKPKELETFFPSVIYVRKRLEGIVNKNAVSQDIVIQADKLLQQFSL